MAIVQPYFDPRESYVAGSVFTNYLASFTQARTAMNEQYMRQQLSAMDPVALQKQYNALTREIDALKKGRIPESDIMKKEADTARQFYVQHSKRANVEAQRSKKAQTKALKDEAKRQEDIETALAKVFDEKEKQKIATYIGKNISAYKNVIKTPEDFKKIPEESRESVIKEALAGVYGTQKAGESLENLKITEFQEIPGLEGVTMDELSSAFIAYHNIMGGEQNDTEYKALKEKATEKSEEKYASDLKKAGGRYIDTSVEGAKKPAAAIYGDYESQVMKENQSIDEQIAALQDQQSELLGEIKKVRSGEVDPYDALRAKGITNIGLHSPFIQEREKARLREGVDLDISGMMPERPPEDRRQYVRPEREVDGLFPEGAKMPELIKREEEIEFLPSEVTRVEEPLVLDEFDASGRTVPFKEGFGRGRGYLKNVMREPSQRADGLFPEGRTMPLLLPEYDASGRTATRKPPPRRAFPSPLDAYREPEADGLFPEGRTMPLLLPEYDASGRTATRKPPPRQAFPSPLDAYRDPEPRPFLGDDEEFDIYGLQSLPEYSGMRSRDQLIQDIMDFQDETGRAVTPKEQLETLSRDQLDSLDEQLRLVQRGYTSEMLKNGFRAETKVDVESQIKVNDLEPNDFDLLRDNNGDFVAVPKGTPVDMNRFTKVPFLTTPKDINIPSLRGSRR